MKKIRYQKVTTRENEKKVRLGGMTLVRALVISHVLVNVATEYIYICLMFNKSKLANDREITRWWVTIGNLFRGQNLLLFFIKDAGQKGVSDI